MTAPRRPWRALVLAALLGAPGLSGCLLAEVPALFGDPPPVPVTGGSPDDGGDGNETLPRELKNVVWTLNDTWVWTSTTGLRLTDRVVDVQTTQRSTGNTTVTSIRYLVRSTVEHGPDLAAKVSYHTYEGTTLGVVNSTGDGVNVTYFRGEYLPWRNAPLLYLGPLTYQTSFNYSRWGDVHTYDRSFEIRNHGLEDVELDIGTFDAWHVTMNESTRKRGAVIPVVQYAHRWFSEEVRNDVRFTRSGALFELVAYRVGEDDRAIHLPPLPEAGDAWRVGWQWTYATESGDTTLTRSVTSCSAIFWMCRASYVWDPVEERDLLAYQTHVLYSATGLPEYQLELLPRGASRPLNASFEYAQPIRRYEYDSGKNHFEYDPAALPLDARPGRYEYRLQGVRYDGARFNHEVIADVQVGPERPYVTVFGPTAVRDVWENLSYRPLDGGVPITESRHRVWSDEFRNDVAFDRGSGNHQVHFELVGVRFGDGRKADRDV